MSDWKPRMQKTVRHLAEQLAGIRPGKLSVGFVETFRISVQGSSVTVGRIAAISSQADRLIVRPFDPGHVPAIVKTLVDSKLNAYALDPRTVSVSVPPISGEQREDLIKHVKKLGEEAKVAVRAIRQSARKEIAASGKGSERAVQAATDEAIGAIDQLVKARSDELRK
jgi:ribosome recycling factor